MNTNSILSSTTIELISKCRKSFKEYVQEIPDNRLLSLAINPLLATRGCKDIIALKDDAAGKRLVERAMRLFKEYIQKFAPSTTENETSMGSITLHCQSYLIVQSPKILSANAEEDLDPCKSKHSKFSGLHVQGCGSLFQPRIPSGEGTGGKTQLHDKN